MPASFTNLSTGKSACATLHAMKLSRHQVIGSVVLALIVLAVLVARAWPLLFPK